MGIFSNNFNELVNQNFTLIDFDFLKWSNYGKKVFESVTSLLNKCLIFNTYACKNKSK